MEGTSKHPFPACCWLHLTYIKCRSRTILLLNEKDQDIRKIGYERFSDLALISMHYKERVPTTMKFARHLCRPIPENCFKHPYLTIVVHRSSNSCNRNLINTTQFYVVLILITKMRWRLGRSPRPRWGSLQRSPDHLAGREGYPSRTLSRFNENYLTTPLF